MLGVSYLEGSGATGNQFQVSLAVADSLWLGSILLQHVVFQVMPDEGNIRAMSSAEMILNFRAPGPATNRLSVSWIANTKNSAASPAQEIPISIPVDFPPSTPSGSPPPGPIRPAGGPDRYPMVSGA
jgi:hypothetical protein